MLQLAVLILGLAVIVNAVALITLSRTVRRLRRSR